MCHCTPGKRTPCCGPACCGIPGGCAFCTPSTRKRPAGPPPPIEVLGFLIALEGIPAIDRPIMLRVSAPRGGHMLISLDEADRLAEALSRATREARARGLT